jgi:oxygen-independent coproporphyrinogen-3 oxidase
MRAAAGRCPDDDAAEMYLRAMETLERAGLAQYEISNVAREGMASRHNLKYWTDESGWRSAAARIRPAPASDGRTCRGPRHIQRVTSGVDPADRRILSASDRLEEALFTGLRLSQGIDIEAVGARYGRSVWEHYGRALEPFLREKWLVREGPRLRLTRDGMLMANEVMATFV